MKRITSGHRIQETHYKNSRRGSDQQPHLFRIQQMEKGLRVEKWVIGKYKYSLTDLLGVGFSSNVYKATLTDNSKEKFALKVINLDKFKDDSLQLLEAEIQIIRNLNHPNIIKCLDVYKTDKNYFLVTEYCPHGDLQELIKLQKQVAQDRALAIMKQIIDAYKYILSKNIIHRDLKPANIMRFGNKWKIGDFGFARYCPQEFVLEKITLGTPLYMALQCLDCSKYSYKSDLFSIGIIFFEMLTGDTPWQGRNQNELAAMMKKTPVVQLPETICPQIKEFIRKTIATDYYARMNKDQFKKLDFDHIDMNKLTELRSNRMSPARTISKSTKKPMLVTPVKNNISKRLKNIGAMTPRIGVTHQLQLPKSRNNRSNNSFRTNYNNKLTLQKQKDSQTKDATYNEYYTTSKKSYKTQFQNYLQQNLQKIYEQNRNKIRNQVQFCKMIVNMIQNIHYFMLDKKERVYLVTLFYSYVVKDLKANGSMQEKYNVLRLENWDTYRPSDQHHEVILEVIESYEKYKAWFNEYLSNLQICFLDKIKESYPQLFQQTNMNFRFYAKFCIQLKQFIILNILKPSKQIDREDRKAYMNGLRQMIYIMRIFEYRSKRENQIKGIGLIEKPEIIENYSISSSMATNSSRLDNNLQKKIEELGKLVGLQNITNG